MNLITESYLVKPYTWYLKYFPFTRGKGLLGRILNRASFKKLIVKDQDSGVKYRLEVGDLITNIILSQGNYEELSLKAARNILEDTPGVFLDVGSNFGLYSCYFATLLGTNCIAVEASYKAFALLMDNIKLNNIQTNVTPCNITLSARNSILPFNSDSDNLGSSRIVSTTSRATNISYVGTSTLDQLLEALNPGEIALMKIDVEGHEIEVLNGINLQGRFRPKYILIEYDNDNNPDLARLLSFLVGAEYEPYALDGTFYRAGNDISEHNLIFKSKLTNP